MLSRKQCALPVITTMALWQLMHLGTSCARTSCTQVFMITYILLSSCFCEI